MRDLTRDSIFAHITMTASPLVVAMIAQVAYQLVNLYFVARMGTTATAGVNAAGTVLLIVNAIAQVLGAGTSCLVANAVGRKDSEDATVVFIHSLILAGACSLWLILLLCVSMQPYLQWMTADHATVEAGLAYIRWASPSYALSLPMAVLGATLRGVGNARDVSATYLVSVLLNILLAPVLIEGWGTGVALGIKGAGLATSVSVGFALVLLGLRFHVRRDSGTVRLKPLRLRAKQYRRILRIGAPSGAEFVVMFLCISLAYYAVRDLGASTQAGFAIGSRILQVILLPAMALALAAGPIAGQNFGAGKNDRVKETFHKTALIGASIMAAVTAVVYWRPTMFVDSFEADAVTLDVATRFLQWMAWSFVGQSIVYTCSVMFQGLGNTVPALISCSVRLSAFAIPVVIWLSVESMLGIERVCCLLLASSILQAAISLWLLHGEFRRRLLPDATAPGTRTSVANATYIRTTNLND